MQQHQDSACFLLPGAQWVLLLLRDGELRLHQFLDIAGPAICSVKEHAGPSLSDIDFVAGPYSSVSSLNDIRAASPNVILKKVALCLPVLNIYNFLSAVCYMGVYRYTTPILPTPAPIHESHRHFETARRYGTNPVFSKSIRSVPTRVKAHQVLW